jgi:UDP-N-acetylmuramoyl-L-alanyl-D-glutamate--2,6-diaminopimelate ligase
VAEIASLLGLDDAEVLEGLAAGAVVPGRFEVVEGEGATVVVDYAHTPDALRSVLGTARELLGPRGRLLAVFGCGGDRDASKRPAMGRVACEIADEVVLTNDNPRSEDPLRIIEEIRSGCSGAPLVLPDRRSAIRAALASADVGDVVVIAGKGHEQGQQFAERSEPFDDRTVAAEERRALYGGAA